MSTKHISGTAAAAVVKFCTQVDYINSQHKDDKSPLKGAWLGPCRPFKFLGLNHISGTVEIRVVKICIHVNLGNEGAKYRWGRLKSAI